MDKVKVGLKRRGSILALVVITIVIFFVIGAALLTLGFNSRIFAIRTAADISARCAADAGLTEAVAVMNVNPSYYFNNPPQKPDTDLPNSEPTATFSYKVYKLPKNEFGIISNEFGVISIGRCNVARRTVWGLLRLRGVGDTGVLVRDSMVLKAGTLVDGRDSRYPNNPNIEVEVQIGTASIASDSMILNNGVYIDGDVLVGFGGNVATVIKDQGATVTGYKGSLDENPEFPPVTPPILPVLNEKIEYKGLNKENLLTGTWQITPLKSGVYTRIDLQQQATTSAVLEIVGGKVVLHITGDIDLGQGCEIRIAKGASLELFVDGNIISREDSGFNNQGLPPDLKLWGQAHDPLLTPDKTQKWQLNAKSEYFGQIYAPEMNVEVKAKGDLYGAFTAYSFNMMSGGNLYYDGALRNVNPNDPGVRFVLNRWGEGAENPPYVAGL